MAKFAGKILSNERYRIANVAWRQVKKREKYNKRRISCNPREWLNCERFGVLPGFLRTRPFPDRTSGSGGNLALKDITMGLRWVRENIGAFGGDPTRITLMGHDTGAALVNLLLLAPYSKGKRGIPSAISN